jgi:hypothetical protein
MIVAIGWTAQLTVLPSACSLHSAADTISITFVAVMEYLGGGEVKWFNSLQQPIQTVDQTRRIIRDVILGLEYCEYFNMFSNQFLTKDFSALPGHYPP